jgi:toxin ParE1/3/4
VAERRRTYRFERTARADLRNSVLWYEEKREGLGSRFATEVQKALELIVLAPQRWPTRRGTNRYALRRFPYTIAYRFTPNEVIILAIAHHRLDPGSWEGR